HCTAARYAAGRHRRPAAGPRAARSAARRRRHPLPCEVRVTILDELHMIAPPDVCFRIAADVERWPEILPHYRRVRFQDRRAFGTGRVEMAAWRDFVGPIRYPTWWVSDMHLDEDAPAVHYRHVDGVTRGMDVV